MGYWFGKARQAGYLPWAGREGEIQMCHIARSASAVIKRCVNPKTVGGAQESFTRCTVAENKITKLRPASLMGATSTTRTRSRLPSPPVIGPATRRHRSTTGARSSSSCHYIYEARRRKVPAGRPSEVHAWVTERSQTRVPASCGSWSKLCSAFKSQWPRSSRGAQSSHPESAFQDHSKGMIPLSVMALQALADAMPKRCRAMVITHAGPRSAVAELMARARTRSRLSPAYGAGAIPDNRGRRAASTPRHQDHDAPCHCRIWSASSGQTHRRVPASRGRLTLHTANGNRYWQEHCGAVHLPSGRLRRRPSGRHHESLTV
jgi:hypothetical protein